MKSEDQWRADLPAERFHILREKGTEPPFSGEFLDRKEDGTYLCGGCGAALFPSGAKFDSGSGWPSFHSAIAAGAIAEHEDTTGGMSRVEITCAACGGHLGHVFPDGPEPTGLRYCVNSLSLDFKEDALG